MKKSWIIGIVAGVVLLVGGYFFYASFLSQDNLLRRIPRDPAWVATLRMKTLAEKIDMERVRQLNMWKTMQGSFRSKFNPEEQEFMDKLTSDPTFSGVNLLQGLYAFGEFQDSRMVTGIVFGVLSASRLEEFLLQAPGSKRVQVREREGCLIVEERGMLLIWDDDSGIALFGNGDLLDYGLGLMQMKEERSILANEAFQANKVNEHDIAFFATYDGLSRGSDRSLREMGSTFDLVGVNLMMSLDFNDTSIDLQAVFSDRVGAPLRNTVLSEKGISDAFIKTALDDKTLGFASLSMNPDRIFQWLRLVPDYGRTMRKLARELGCSVNDLEETFGGQMVIGFSGMRKYDFDGADEEKWSASERTVEQYADTMVVAAATDEELPEATSEVEDMEAGAVAVPDGIEYNPFLYEGDLTNSPYPEFNLTFSMNRPEVFRTLMQRAGIGMITQNHWRFIDDGVIYHLIQTDEGITITTVQEHAESLVSSGRLGSRPGERISNLASSMPVAAYVNINPDDYMQEFLSSRTRSKQALQLNTLLQDLDHLELSTSGAESRFAIHFKPGDGNTLFRLFALADRLALAL